MSDESIAPFVSGTIDAGTELRALGVQVASYVLYYLQGLVTGARRLDNPAAFFTAEDGTPVHKVDRAGCFAVFVIETEPDASIAITVLFAGRQSLFASPNQLPDVWDAAAVARARTAIEPRLKDFLQ